MLPVQLQGRRPSIPLGRGVRHSGQRATDGAPVASMNKVWLVSAVPRLP